MNAEKHFENFAAMKQRAERSAYFCHFRRLAQAEQFFFVWQAREFGQELCQMLGRLPYRQGEHRQQAIFQWELLGCGRGQPIGQSLGMFFQGRANQIAFKIAVMGSAKLGENASLLQFHGRPIEPCFSHPHQQLQAFGSRRAELAKRMDHFSAHLGIGVFAERFEQLAHDTGRKTLRTENTHGLSADVPIGIAE
ncbi:hypothetical protein HRbin36_02588 [bacterium HR36]|nr:hypothetical protein HRbin36_02588 [bacterium HR36]